MDARQPTETATPPPVLPADPTAKVDSADEIGGITPRWRAYLKIAVLALLPLAAIAAPLTVLRPAVGGAERWLCARDDLLARAPAGLKEFVCGGEAAAYANFRQCVQNKPACDRRACADAYLNSEPQSPRRREVADARAKDDAICRDGAQGALYQEFEGCLSGKAACAKRACIDKYLPRFTGDPFATKLQGAAAEAEQACLDADEAAYIAYGACKADKSGCALRACAQAYLTSFATGRHSADLRGAQAFAQLSCDENDRREIQAQRLTQIVNCMAAKSGCAKKGCLNAVASMTSEPYVARLRELQSEADQECAAVEQGRQAYQRFRDCISAAPACSSALCDTKYGARLHEGPYAAALSEALQAGKTACARIYDTAARDFLARFYELHRNGASTSAAQWADMCAPRVRQRDLKGNEGPSISSLEFANDKVAYFRKNRTPSYRIDDQTISVDCDQGKRICEISADVYIDRWRRKVTLDLVGPFDHPRLAFEGLLAD